MGNNSMQLTPGPGKIMVLGMETTTSQVIQILIGPALYLACIFMTPLGGDVTSRGGLGIILWAAWYWGTGVIPTGYTIFIPIFGAAFLPGMKWAAIMKSLIHPDFMMLLGPAIIVCMWARWGLARRIALFFLSQVGTSVKAQATVWIILATCLSFVAANTVIAIALTPIAIEMLNHVGYDTADKKRKSLAATLIILSIAIGASLGGFMTPMAGGQAVITWNAMKEALGAEVTMWSHTSRMIVPVFLSMIPVVILFRYVFPTDVKHFEGSVDFYREELRKMGKMTKAEKWALVWFLLAVALPFLKPLYAPYVPIDMTPSMIFSCLVGILLLLPAPDEGAPSGKTTPYEPGERFLSVNSIKIFPIHAFMLWPIAMSIAQIVNDSGASDLMGGFLGPAWTMPAFVGVGLMVLFCILLAQPASDTGAAGMLAPVVVAGTLAAGANPVPWLFIMGYTVNFSFCIPAATGTMAVPIAFEGKAHPRLPLYGIVVVVFTGLVSWLFWGAVLHFDWTFWQTVTTIPK